MRKILRRGMYLAALAASTIAMASDTLSVPKETPKFSTATVAPELKRMDVWIGHWQSKTQVLNTPYSQAESMSSEMTCSWSPSHSFVLCEHVMHGPNGTTNSLSVYTYDEADKVYKFFGVEKDSYPREVPMQVNGNVWSFGTEVRSQDKTIMFLTSDEFLSDRSMRFRTEFSDDNGEHWSRLNQGELTKIG
jgi:hypothetical protein